MPDFDEYDYQDRQDEADMVEAIVADLAADEKFGTSICKLAADVEAGIVRPFGSLQEYLDRIADESG